MSLAASIGRRLRRPRKVWIWIAVAAGLVQVMIGYLSLHPHPFESVPQRESRLSKQHAIVITDGDPAAFFVPPYGPADAAIDDMKIIGADPTNVPAALEGIEDALSVYPPWFVSRLVRAIFIAGELQFNTERAGGFTGPAWILIAAPDSSGPSGIRLNAVESLHHELSSFVLQKANAMPEWAALAPVDWVFTTTSEAALSHGTDPDPALDTGFLSAYGATTAENDFNTYAEKMFTEPERLVRLACEHAIVRKKLLFVLQTYVNLDGRMEKTFRELGIDRAHLCEH
jgi:hypothetical protein